ncbi:MAG: Ldh family oxidoreductase [Rhodocyclales bacterium GT-UBC]|nr:MAG: Ldh family oxidoreductase [Rhodocyclales bacterium GT-UBC]
MPALSLEALQNLATQALIAAGAAPAAAIDTALALVAADAAGLASHGVSRIPLYAAHLRHGRVDGQAIPRVIRSSGAVRVIDAGDGLAYPACRLAVGEAIAVARLQGIGLASVVRSNHFGAAAHHLEAVAEAGLVGLALGNSPAAIAPWGGKTPLFGTNPIAAIFPRRAAAPLVIDLSLSEVARGKLLVAAQNKQAIPPTWALAPDGTPTTDPELGLQGSMLPAGGVKGAMLALWVELLIGAVAGAAFAFEADSFFSETGNKAAIGQLFLVINPAALSGSDSYAERLEVLLAAMSADAGVRLPGCRRDANRARAERDGIELPEKLLRQLQQLAAAQ